jgi:lysine 2,3-aminomutase
MAGARAGVFKELITPFLHEKLALLRRDHGEESREYLAIARQYIKSDLEEKIETGTQRRRHYEAEVHVEFNGVRLAGVERLYRNTVLLEPTTACAAHCRWCLRGQYEIGALNSAQILSNLDYFASLSEISEILITGGEPLIAVSQLEFILDKIDERVPQVEVVRIGARLLTHAPERLTERTMRVLAKRRRFRIEIGLHICHPIEFWDETVEKIRTLRGAGITLYNQHPLLKGVNDNEQDLIQLYRLMRQHGVEAHYLFHCIPMQGMSHHRTSLERGLQLISILASGGQFSGRSKPIFAAMTDIGKVSLFQNSVAGRDDLSNRILLKSRYRYDERMSWNPAWVQPDSCVIDEEGYMSVWYPDGSDA